MKSDETDPQDPNADNLSGNEVSVETGGSGFRSGFVAVVGRTNAGKSSLLNAIVGEKISIVTHKSQTTRNLVSGIKNYPQAQIVFLDTPGFVAEKHRNELGRFLEESLRQARVGATVTLVVIDCVKLIERPQGAANIADSVRERGFHGPYVVALNKVDLVAKESLLPVIAEVYRAFSVGPNSENVGVEIVPVSATKGDGVAELEQVILRYIPEGPQYYPDDQVTNCSESFLAQEIIREKLYVRLHKELPYSISVAVEKWEESPEILRIWASIILSRASQKPIVLGSKGEVLKEVGTKARLELEEIFGSKVHLDLHVKVEEDWNSSLVGLRKAGLQL